MQRIGDILGKIISFNGGAQSRVTIYESWPHIVKTVFLKSGGGLSEEVVNNAVENSKVLEINDSKMIVTVTHTGWSQILSSRKTDIIAFLRQNFPDAPVNEISFILKKQRDGG